MKRSPATDSVLISMPFDTIVAPSIGLSLLKAGLARRRISSRIHYFSIRFAELVGWFFYRDIAHAESPSTEELAGEWIFNRALFETTAADDSRYVREILVKRAAWTRPVRPIDQPVIARVLRARARVERFLDDCVGRVLDDEPRIVGFTSSNQQHVASLALAKRIKALRPDVAIVFGGANCQDVMGAETLRQFSFVDAAVSGEGDVIVPELFERLLAGHPVDGLPGVRTREEIERQPPEWSSAPRVEDLDTLPFPDYSDFFEQFEASRFGRTWQPGVFFESSRGCWWGQKSRCTFCGLNGSGVAYRSKSSARALDEIVHLTKTHPGCDIQAIDNILDMKYFDDLIPKLATLRVKADLLYETKSNLRKEQVRKLRNARILGIQAGIESLSDSVLRLMGKGVTALQNIQLLKWCRELGVHPYWNFLWGFPGEDPAEYRRMAALIPLLSHLEPPESICDLRLDRFSRFFEQASIFGFSDVRPLASYRHIYPFAEATIGNLAYSFAYGFQDGRSPVKYVRPLLRRVRSWQSRADDVDLFSVDLGESVFICDLRLNARRFLTVLSGFDRKIYLAADSITDARTLGSSLNEPPDQITRRLDRMVRRGLMLCEGHRYLALAIPVGEYQPGQPTRTRFRREMRKIGRRVRGGTRITLSEPLPVAPCRPQPRRHIPPGAIDSSLFVVQDERTIFVRGCD